MQALVAALIVAASLAYAAWALMPAAWRHALLRRATGRVPAAAGGGCGGCAGGCAPPARRSTPAAAGGAEAGCAGAAARPIVLHRRPPR